MKIVLFSLLAASLGFGAAQLLSSTNKHDVQPVGLNTEEKLTCSEDSDGNEIEKPKEDALKESELPPSIVSLLQEKDARIVKLEHEVAKLSPTSETIGPEADNPEYREKLAAEILDLTETKDQIEDAFAAVGSTMFKGESPETKKYYSELMQKYFGWDVLEKNFLKLYTDVYSAQELSDIAHFYRSDVGLSMTKKQPELMQKTMEMIQKINQDRMPEFQRDLDAFMKSRTSKHRDGTVVPSEHKATESDG